MHQNATVAEWYREHGKHPVYANPRQRVPLPVEVTPVTLKISRDGRLVDWPHTPRSVRGRAGAVAAERMVPTHQ